jgi:hypothetical protein
MVRLLAVCLVVLPIAIAVGSRQPAQASPAAVPANPPSTTPAAPIDWVAHVHGSETPAGGNGAITFDASFADGPGSCGFESGSVVCNDVTSGAVSSGTLTGPFADCNGNVYTVTEPALTGRNNYIDFLTSPVAGFPIGQVGEVDVSSGPYTTDCPDGSSITNALIVGPITGPSDCTPFTLSPSKDTASGSCSGNSGGPYSFTFTISATYGLSITSPPADKVLALTDGQYFTPQPGSNDRQPEERTLAVEGTAPPGTASITPNGIKAELSGDNWKADLPVTMADLGELTLTASDGTDKVEQKDTLIDILITSPTEDQDVPMTTEPAMPDLDGRVEVAGYGGDTSNVTFNWVLNVRGKYRTRCGNCKVGEWQNYSEEVANGSQVGTEDPWKPDYTETLGGWGRLEVTATLPGVLDNPVASEPRWVNIPGANPGKAAVEGFIDDHAGDLANTDKHIACWESGHSFNQFNPAADGREPASDTIPADWKPNPAPLRPLFGGLPAGIGIMQKDPADFPDMQWNWQDNVLAGIAEYAGDYAAAGQSRAKAQHKLDAQLNAVLAVVNAARAQAHLPVLQMTAIQIPDLTDNQLTRQALSFYNRGPGNPEYRFDATYAPTADHLDVTLSGTQQWKEVHYAEDYPTLVLSCKI